MFKAGYDAPPNCGMASGDGPLKSIRRAAQQIKGQTRAAQQGIVRR
jgi:hypothetical protein